MSLYDAHRLFSWIVVGSNGLAGLWVLAGHWVDAVRHRTMWWFVGAAQATIAIQVILGVVVRQVDSREASGLHMFYGFIAFATVGIIYSYRQQVEPWRHMLFGLGGLFLMGLALRSMTLI